MDTLTNLQKIKLTKSKSKANKLNKVVRQLNYMKPAEVTVKIELPEGETILELSRSELADFLFRRKLEILNSCKYIKKELLTA